MRTYVGTLVSVLNRLKARIAGQPDASALVRRGLQLGNNVYLGPGVALDESHCWLISIADDCSLAPRVQILAHDASTKRHLGFTKIGHVRIGRRTFIGASSIVLPGVTIGTDVIVGAGSVVARDVPSGMVVCGNPAAVVCTTAEYLQRNRELMRWRPVYPEKGYTIQGGITGEGKQRMRAALGDEIGYVE